MLKDCDEAYDVAALYVPEILKLLELEPTMNF